MNSNNNLKSGQKTLAMQMLILAIVIILIAFIGLFIQKSSANNIFNNGFKSYQQSAKLLKDLNAVHANLYRLKSMVASSQDKKEITKLSDQQIAVINEDINFVKKTMESDISEEQEKYYKALLDNLVEYQKSSLQVIRLAPMGTGAAYLSAANEKMEAITQLLSQLLDHESNIAEKGYSSVSSTFYIVGILLLVLLVLCFVLIPSLIKKMISGSVTEPLQEASGVLREFANGKYNKSLVWDSDDAIGELVQSVNSLRSKMSTGTAQKTPVPDAAFDQKTSASETAQAHADEKAKSLSEMIKKSPEQTKDVDKLVTSSRKAIDKLQDI